MRRVDGAMVRGFLCRAALVLASLWSVMTPTPSMAGDAPSQLAFQIDEGTWLSVAVSPDGRTILFDLLGDIYRLDSGGGTAEALIAGPAFETQPIFSPDGRRIVFISDRSGSENVWIADADGANARALSTETEVVFVDPAWSADGEQVYVTRFDSRNRRVGNNRGALWVFHHLGGGMPIEGEVESRAPYVIAASPSADGKFLYFAAPGGSGEAYGIYRRELAGGRSILLISGESQGTGSTRPTGMGVMQPVASPDGTMLAYAASVRGLTELRLRDLRSGADRRLIPAIEPSLARQFLPFQGALPRYAFTPDSKAIVIGYGGKLRRLQIATGALDEIPFSAQVRLATESKSIRDLPRETGAVRARLIQAPSLSPDGQRLAFSVFGKLYVASLTDGTPRRLTRTPLSANDVTENQPAWSPDGRWIIYASWSSAGGHLWRVRSDGTRNPQRLTQSAAYYRKPVYTPDGKSILALRSSIHDQRHLFVRNGVSPQRPFAQEVVRIPAEGGRSDELVTYLPASRRASDHGRLHFSGETGSVFVQTSDGMMMFPAQVGTPRTVLRIVAGPGPEQSMDDALLSPDGRWVLVLHEQQLHLYAVPSKRDAMATLDLNAPALFHRRLTEIGADDFGWSRDGRQITWSVGATFYQMSLSEVLATPAHESVDEGCIEDRLRSVSFVVEAPRDAPAGQFVLRGARAVTMRGEEILERADIVIDGNRISAIGPSGSVPLPAGAVIHDLAGKTVTPGFVDTHAHYYATIGRQIIDYDAWEYPAALAYGITSALDPQSFTPDMFVYHDLIDAGVISGPRARTTGPGIFASNDIRSSRQAACQLRRYRDHYRTHIVKAYMIGSREQRQRMARSARELGMMAVTENWGTPRYALTQALDGFATNEHASDAIDFYRDYALLYARLGTGYSPTTLIGGAAGPPATDYFLKRDDLLSNEKLRRFVPAAVLDARQRRASWAVPEDFIFARLATSAAKIFRAGGNVGVGSHGEVPGLSYHWELEALSAGGLTPHELLQIATRGSAAVVGRLHEVGTLEPGKYADLLVFDQDPLQDIRNSVHIGLVLKNGRPYDQKNIGPHGRLR